MSVKDNLSADYAVSGLSAISISLVSSLPSKPVSALGLSRVTKVKAAMRRIQREAVTGFVINLSSKELPWTK